jgi:hypothetical protein
MLKKAERVLREGQAFMRSLLAREDETTVEPYRIVP